MELSWLLLVCLLVAAWAVLAAAAAADVPAAPSPRPAGCATTAKCGDIDVPYPFALEPQCVIDSSSLFHLKCNTTTSKLEQVIGRNLERLEVIKISVPENKVWVKTWISRQCFNQSTDNNTIFSV